LACVVATICKIEYVSTPDRMTLQSSCMHPTTARAKVGSTCKSGKSQHGGNSQRALLTIIAQYPRSDEKSCRRVAAARFQQTARSYRRAIAYEPRQQRIDGYARSVRRRFGSVARR
jgi:hypothetical protein